MLSNKTTSFTVVDSYGCFEYAGIKCCSVEYYLTDMFGALVHYSSILPASACKPQILLDLATVHNAQYLTCSKYGDFKFHNV